MRILLSLLCLSLPVLAAPQKPSPRKPETPAPAAPAPEKTAETGVALDASVKTKIDGFFNLVKARRVADGFKTLFEGCTMADEQPKKAETLTRNTAMLVETCGEMESASIVRVRGVGATLREVVCIMNCRKRPMRWTFFVYKAEGRWQVIDAEVDLELHRFFESDKSAAD